MFEELIKKVSANIATVRAIVQTNERLRQIAFAQSSATRQESDDNAELTALIEGVPGEREWRVYDHCAVVTRLYAIYERFVEELITDWLRMMPSIIAYSDLGEQIQNTHRQGVGRLLLDLKKNRFKHLSIENVVRGLFDGVAGKEEYELIPDAFLFHEQNLRRDVLHELFVGAGIPNAWGWVEKHRGVKQFVEDRVSENTAEGELNELIAYRNEAAHGSVDEILASGRLLELGEFIEILCQALAELVSFQVISRKVSTGQAREIGQVTEWFKKPKAAVARLTNITLFVGKSLFLVSETSSYCCLAVIRSIQIDDVQKDEVEIFNETEVGLQFDIEAKKGVTIYALE